MDRHGSPSLGPKHDGSSRVTKGGESAADRLAALKARVAAAIGNSSNKGGSGLGVALHPALADVASTTKPSAKPSASTSSSSDRNSYHPKSASRSQHPASQKQKQLDLSAPSADEIKSNPYYDANLQGPQQRQARTLQFHQRGHFIQQGQALRRQAQLEALKAKIAATSKRVGIDEDRDIERAFLVEDVPDIEWYV
jgi:U4/U6 small nuclear ribonucleoprotein PRP3